MFKVRDYKCNHCGFEWEVFAKDGHKVPCPRCDSPHTDPQIGATAFKVGGVGGYDKRMKV